MVGFNRDKEPVIDRYYNEGKHLNSFEIEHYVKKHSKNIIDLIEVGDYVNGKLVSNVDKVDNTNFIEWDDGDMCSTEIPNDKFIHSIVTKEKFLQAEYKIEKGE